MEFSYLTESILNDVTNPQDYNSPYSFLAFMQFSNVSKIDVNDELKYYQKYLNYWAKKRNFSKNKEKELVRDAYINLLREITLNYSTAEEKRFILNADFSDDSDLDIVIPFFIQKLKQISFFYIDKRQQVKNNVIRYNLKGSNFGVENIIKKIVYEYVTENYTSNVKELSSFYNNFDISIDELFSNSDLFFDEKNKSDFSYSNKIDPNVFLNIKDSILNAIESYNFFLETSENTHLNSFSYNPIFENNDLDLLKERDFINYFKSGENNLKLNLLKNLYPKYIGTDFHYISTNSQNEVLSGILFESNDFNGQYLNKNFPTNTLLQPLNELYSTYELGGFFTPQNVGMLVYNTPKKTYKINVEELAPDKIYIFPNPNKIKNNESINEDRTFLAYSIDVQWNRSKISNGLRLNDVISNNYNQLFYAYQSEEQNLKLSTGGMGKTKDNITFWGGDKDQIWEGSFDLNINPIDKDNKDLLLDEGIVVDWYPDEYNNEFALYKKINSYSKKILDKQLNDGGVILGSETEFEKRELNDVSIYDKKNTEKGKIFIRNNFFNEVNNIVDSLSSIFLKYPEDVINEISDSVIKFFLINNIFVIETKNYVVSDTYDYDIETNVFSSNKNTFYLKKTDHKNNFLEAFVNPWYDEKNNKLFLVFLKTLHNYLSSSNYKHITPEIYGTDVNNFKYKKIYPVKETYTNVYSLSTPYGDIPEINLVEYCGGSFTKNSFLNEYNFTYMAKNLNSMPFIVNEKLKYDIENNTFKSEMPLLLKPFYYFLDNNYANPEPQYFVKGTSNRSGYLGLKDEDSLNLIESGAKKTNYAFASEIDVFQINEIGRYIINFDWESYNDVNVYVGCSAINVRDIENNILINYKSDYIHLTAHEEEKEIFKFDIDDSEFVLKIHRPTYPQNDVLIFDVESTNNSTFSGKFCGESIYKKIKIIKKGGGIGDVYTEPSCIQCGYECEYLYPKNSTITLIASASNLSEFVGWGGDSECAGNVNDCVITIDEDKEVIAYFNLLPLYKINVSNTYGSVISLDKKINVNYGSDEAFYYLKSFVTLSAAPPSSRDYIFRRFLGAPCYSGDRVCTFIVYSDMLIEALYSEIIYYDLNLTIKSEVEIYPPILFNTIAGERELKINTKESLLLTPFPKGTIEWEVYKEPINIASGTEYASLSENTYVSMTAIPYNERYYFKEWLSGPCKNSNNSICEFSLEDNTNAIAYFELIRYTVTLIVSGGGLYTIQSNPLGIACDSTGIISDPICEYSFLSGTTITLSASDLIGSDFATFSSYDVPSVHSNTISFYLTGNVTLTAINIPYDRYTLSLYKYGNNKVIFETNPTSYLYSDLSSTYSEAMFPNGTNVKFVETYSTNNSKILYYKTSIPISNRYIAGNGIVMSSPHIDITTGENDKFILVNESLIINDSSLGAPYAESELEGDSSGILINYTSFSNIMTESIEVSAFITSKIPTIPQIQPTPTPTQTPTNTSTPNKSTPTPTPTLTQTLTPSSKLPGIITMFYSEQLDTFNDEELFLF
jgi:hypothetical protein